MADIHVLLWGDDSIGSAENENLFPTYSYSSGIWSDLKLINIYIYIFIKLLSNYLSVCSYVLSELVRVSIDL